MIVVKLKGGLGNQMFQYAFGRSVSLRTERRLVLDCTHYLSQRHFETQRFYELSDFGIHAQIGLARWQVAMLHCSRKKRGLKKKIADIAFPVRHIVEGDLAYKPDIGDTAGNCYFDGYWQCERYFLHHRAVLLRDFCLRMPLSARSEALLADIRRSACAVALHIRRGDYVSSASASAVHGACTVDYYRRAMAHLENSLGRARFFVFSDDIAWAQENLGKEHELVFADYSAPVKACEDMHLISACHHQIIANSSFSWWGAWLNDNDSKIVVSPAQWFHAAHMDSSDMVPSSWIRL